MDRVTQQVTNSFIEELAPKNLLVFLNLFYSHNFVSRECLRVPQSEVKQKVTNNSP